MRKVRFKETKIVRVPKDIEGGRQVQEVCREYGKLTVWINPPTDYSSD